MHHCSPRAVVAALAVAAAVLWGVAIAAIWLPVNSRAFSDDLVAGGALTILAGAPWMLRLLFRDPVVRHLGDAVISSRRAARPATGPHRVRGVHAR